MIPARARDLIETWRLGFVATADAEGRPNVSPKGTFLVLDDHTLAFGEMRSPNTMHNIGLRPEVEVNFVDTLSRKGVRVRGATRVAERGSEEFERLYPQFEAIWSAELGALFNAIVLIEVSECRPLQSPIFEAGGDETALRADWKARIAAMPDGAPNG